MASPTDRTAGPKPQLELSEAGFVEALKRLDWKIRTNTRSDAIEWRRGRAKWAANTDGLEAAVQCSIEGDFDVSSRIHPPLRFGADRWKQYRNATAHGNQVDPFLEWVEALPKWDGTERLSTLLSRCFKVSLGADQNDRLIRWASRFPYCGAIARADSPGIKLDELPVLIGDQSIGKSTYIRHMFGPLHGHWFGDEFSFNANPQQRVEATLGKVVVELSEMRGSTRAELSEIKQFLSREVDEIRLPYRANPSRLPRRFVMVGSTNDAESLPNDPSGNRRFVALEVGAGPDGVVGVRFILQREREQLWAEALHIVRENTLEVWLPDSLKPAQRDTNEGHRRRDDSLEEAVAEFTANYDPEKHGESLAIGEIKAALLEGPQRVGSHELGDHALGRALKHEGWEKQRRRWAAGGRKSVRWVLPDAQPEMFE